ncbi:hypothetical protein DFR30_0974 [Thiogranum longum]|uniref:Phosphate-selective porin O/P n=1 Tax=Thiogranum longum TaxID=1537524 RepID=A0A4R1HKL1_9GAMM|nr:hypothetical protein [Thiogranum longum]TCK17732.1 hypothetical protein DFR30_0974 [Thiogranum longum]
MALAVAASGVLAASPEDIEALHRELSDIRAAYEARVKALETRIELLEKNTQQQSAASVPPVTVAPVAQERANDFNPAISVVLTGTLADFSSNNDARVPGMMSGGESDPGVEGFSVGESELNITANIDDRWLGNLTLAVSDTSESTEVGVEEAWFQSLALPYDLTFRGGRFFSAVGYRNEFHAHADDFVDRSLAYRMFLGGQYLDDGVQLRWLAPTDPFLEFGAEYLRGDNFPAAGAGHQGRGVWDVFAHAGGDAGISHSWKAGISWMAARAKDRDSVDGSQFNGDVRLAIADAVWKWAPNGNSYRHSAKLEGALFWQNQDGRFRPAGGGSLPYDEDQSGGYVNAVYKFMPQWRTGLRYSWLNAGNPGAAFDGTTLDPLGESPDTWSLMVDWSRSEFSRLRLQYSRDNSDVRAVDRLYLQYIYSMGAHGAHPF